MGAKGREKDTLDTPLRKQSFHTKHKYTIRRLEMVTGSDVTSALPVTNISSARLLLDVYLPTM